MQFVFFDDYQPGLLRNDGVISCAGLVNLYDDHQKTLRELIAKYTESREPFEQLLASSPTIPLNSVTLQAPVPEPSKIMCMAGNYREGTGIASRPIRGFLAPPSAVLAPGGTAVLPIQDFRVCQHEAELVCVIGETGRNIDVQDALNHVFGYTAGVDISPRNEDWRFMGKCCDGFKPIGPCITTSDEIGDPHDLQVRLSVDGEPRQDYNTRDIAHSVAECISWFSSFMTILPGDLLFMGTNHQQLGALQDGDTVAMAVDKIGTLTFSVADPRKRTWPKGIDEHAASHARRLVEEAAEAHRSQ